MGQTVREGEGGRGCEEESYKSIGMPDHCIQVHIYTRGVSWKARVHSLKVVLLRHIH